MRNVGERGVRHVGKVGLSENYKKTNQIGGIWGKKGGCEIWEKWVYSAPRALLAPLHASRRVVPRSPRVSQSCWRLRTSLERRKEPNGTLTARQTRPAHGAVRPMRRGAAPGRTRRRRRRRQGRRSRLQRSQQSVAMWAQVAQAAERYGSCFRRRRRRRRRRRQRTFAAAQGLCDAVR